MIIIPAAGEGRRFADAGYSVPKHDIPLAGTPMVDWVRANARLLDPTGSHFVITKEFVGPTRGAVETIVKGYDLVSHLARPGDPLIIANCDQLVDFPDVANWGWGNGLVFTFKSANPAHSYVETLGPDAVITDIVEKPATPPSERAVSGVYAFPVAAPFIDACRWVLGNPPALAGSAERLSADAELYVSRALCRMIDEGYTLYAVDAPTAILGTPEDFQRFETALRFQGIEL